MAEPEPQTEREHGGPFSWQELRAADPELLHDGRWGNSKVFRVHLAGATWAVKTYCYSPWWYRKTFARFWTGREHRVMTALSRMGGIPKDPWLLDDCSLCCKYEEGRTLLDVRLNPVPVSKRYFLLLEETVHEMHKRGYVHLDLRNGRNILILDDMTPLLLDFQSCVGLKIWPEKVRQVLRNIDLSGVYKWWNRLSPDTMDSDRFALYQRLNRERVLWPFKGYGSWLRLWRPEPLRSCEKKED